MKIIQYISFCFLLFYSAVGFSQNSTIDSLSNVLKLTRNDIDRSQLLNAIADEYKATDPQLMLKYANEALVLSKKIKHTTAEGNAYLNIGNANIILGNYPMALQNFSNAQVIFEKARETNPNDKDIKNGLARAYGSIGVVCSEQSNYAKALQYHLKAVKIYEESNNLEKCARVYNNIGIVYRAQGEDFKALDYFIKCLKTQEKTGDNTVGITTTNIGNIYLSQNNFPKAFEYYTKAKKLFEKYPNERGSGELYNNLGLYYKEIKNSAKALENFNLAIQSFEAIDDKFGASATYGFIGDIYFEQKVPYHYIMHKCIYLSL